jgi:hypothetical protein
MRSISVPDVLAGVDRLLTSVSSPSLHAQL